MTNDNFEWWEDESGEWYYRSKTDPDGEWHHWEKEDEQSDSTYVNTELEVVSETPVYCKGMDWDDMLLHIKYLKKMQNYLQLHSMMRFLKF